TPASACTPPSGKPQPAQKRSDSRLASVQRAQTIVIDGMSRSSWLEPHGKGGAPLLEPVPYVTRRQPSPPGVRILWLFLFNLERRDQGVERRLQRGHGLVGSDHLQEVADLGGRDDGDQHARVLALGLGRHARNGPGFVMARRLDAGDLGILALDSLALDLGGFAVGVL